MIRGFKAAIFDMDGTLLDSERVYLASFRAAEAAVRAGAEDALYLEMVGMGDTKSDRMMRDRLGDKADAFIDYMRTDLKTRFEQPVPLKATAQALLDLLSGTPLAIATSTREGPAKQRLDLAGIGRHFPVLVGGDMVTRGKPAPDIYLMAAERLGVAPADCVAFEDSETGTQSALAAGMVTVQVPDMVPAQNTEGEQIVADNLLEGARKAGLIA